jgi:Domain of unknown function (DUF6430)
VKGLGTALKSYWSLPLRKVYISLGFLKTFLSPLGSIWLATNMTKFMYPDLEKYLASWWLYILCAVTLYAIIARWPKTEFLSRIDGTEITISLQLANLFKFDGAWVIPTNTTFDTQLGEPLIAPESLQGLFTAKIYDGNAAHLDADLALWLQQARQKGTRPSRVNGKSQLFDIGTCAKVTAKGQTAFLVAIAEMNEMGTASTDLENVKVALAGLWNFIRVNGGPSRLVIPLVGMGKGRAPVAYKDIIQAIALSFIAASAEGRVADLLSIVVCHADHSKGTIDLNSLSNFIDHHCRYTQVLRANGILIGNPIPLSEPQLQVS